jgi:hypothetical protein
VRIAGGSVPFLPLQAITSILTCVSCICPMDRLEVVWICTEARHHSSTVPRTKINTTHQTSSWLSESRRCLL